MGSPTKADANGGNKRIGKRDLQDDPGDDASIPPKTHNDGASRPPK